jgi:hypothetical protein
LHADQTLRLSTFLRLNQSDHHLVFSAAISQARRLNLDPRHSNTRRKMLEIMQFRSPNHWFLSPNSLAVSWADYMNEPTSVNRKRTFYRTYKCTFKYRRMLWIRKPGPVAVANRRRVAGSKIPPKTRSTAAKIAGGRCNSAAERTARAKTQNRSSENARHGTHPRNNGDNAWQHLNKSMAAPFDPAMLQAQHLHLISVPEFFKFDDSHTLLVM